MADPGEPDKGDGLSAGERRRYDSPLRRQRTSETRERILRAGSALAHEFPTWDWRGLTPAAVAARAGVNKTTIYRHFPSESALHEAIMQRLEDEAGISYEDLEVGNLEALVGRAFAHLSSSFAGRPEVDDAAPTVDADRRRRDALTRAVASAAAEWSPSQRRMAAAILDILWARNTHERLTQKWDLDAEQTIEAVTWAIALLLDAVRDGRRPGPEPG